MVGIIMCDSATVLRFSDSNYTFYWDKLFLLLPIQCKWHLKPSLFIGNKMIKNKLNLI